MVQTLHTYLLMFSRSAGIGSTKISLVINDVIVMNYSYSRLQQLKVQTGRDVRLRSSLQKLKRPSMELIFSSTVILILTYPRWSSKKGPGAYSRSYSR